MVYTTEEFRKMVSIGWGGKVEDDNTILFYYGNPGVGKEVYHIR